MNEIVEEWLKFCEEEDYRSNLTAWLNTKTELENLEDENLTALWSKFANFLKENSNPITGEKIALSEIFGTPSECLKLFDEEYGPEIRTDGPSISISGRDLCTQQTLGSLIHRNWLKEIYPDVLVKLEPIRVELANIPHGEPKDAYLEWFDSFVVLIGESLEELGAEATDVDFEDEWDASVARGDLERELVWLTFEEDASSLVNTGAIPKTNATRSYAAALHRYVAGLFHPSDLSSSDELIEAAMSVSSLEAGGNIYAHKTLIKLNFAPTDGIVVSQPTLFSRGYEDLFVSRAPDSIKGGRACRLIRKSCGHLNDRCKCAGSGLPEVVSTASNLGDNTRAKISDISAILSKHLRLFEKPSVSFIESKTI